MWNCGCLPMPIPIALAPVPCPMSMSLDCSCQDPNLSALFSRDTPLLRNSTLLAPVNPEIGETAHIFLSSVWEVNVTSFGFCLCSCGKSRNEIPQSSILYPPQKHLQQPAYNHTQESAGRLPTCPRLPQETKQVFATRSVAANQTGHSIRRARGTRRHCMRYFASVSTRTTAHTQASNIPDPAYPPAAQGPTSVCVAHLQLPERPRPGSKIALHGG